MRGYVWHPTEEVVERSHLARLMREHGIGSYRELVARSVADPEWWWSTAIEAMGLEFFDPFAEVVDLGRGLEWATWFEGGTLNAAWNSCHRWAVDPADGARAAVVSHSESGERTELTYGELSDRVTRLAEGLLALGLEPGDRVGLFLPMCVDAVVASHACAHAGLVQVPVFSGYGAPSVAERLAHGGLRAVVTADGTVRRGRVSRMKETLDEALPDAPSVEHVVVLANLGLEDVPMEAGRDRRWEDVVAGMPGTLAPLRLDAEHPYLLAYTSGTTGRPKGVVHSHGGFSVPICAHNYFLSDIHPDDRMLFVTDMGWIMGPWTVMGGGFCGCTIVFLEGAPDWPADRLWRTMEEERVSVLGISPTVARALMPHGDPTADLTALRAFMTTGEPWNRDPYMWLFEKVGGGRCPVINASGGTEAGVLLSCCVLEPIKACSLGLPAPGQDMDVLDADGTPVRGGLGELVCRNAWPSLTRGLWREEERYLETYWSRYPGVYAHGDWASVDEDGCWFLHGRSDDTMNVAGKRIGPAEIESAAVAHAAVAEAAAVGIPHAVKGEAAWLFCCLVPGAEASDTLAAEILDAVAAGVGRAFRPERCVFVEVLPKTRSQKVVRRAIRAAVVGDDPGDLSAVENPGAIGAIARLVAHERR